MVDARDVAAVAATALVGGGLTGRTLTLTGPEAPTFAEIAARTSRAAGRTITHVDPGADGMRSLLLGAGLPPPAAALVLSFYDGLRFGRHAVITDDVAEAMAQPPLSFAGFAGAWRPLGDL